MKKLRNPNQALQHRNQKADVSCFQSQTNPSWFSHPRVKTTIITNSCCISHVRGQSSNATFLLLVACVSLTSISSFHHGLSPVELIMNDGSYIDPKQETRPIQIKISFDSTEEEWRFVCAVSDVKEIKISGREDGSFDCKIKR